MGKIVLSEALAALRENDHTLAATVPGSDNTGFRLKGASKNFTDLEFSDQFPYNSGFDEGGPANATTQFAGRGGGQGHNLGNKHVPHLQHTWEGGPETDEDGMQEANDFDQERRHGLDKVVGGLWNNTIQGKDVKKRVKDAKDEIEESINRFLNSVRSADMLSTEAASIWYEAMGAPTQLGRPDAKVGDFPLRAGTGEDAEPVRNPDGTPQSSDNYLLRPQDVDIQGGPGTQWNAHGVSGDISARKNLGNQESKNMRLREFFSGPIEAEEIDNPEQDYHGDSTDNELDAGGEEESDLEMHSSSEEEGDEDNGDDIEIDMSSSSDDELGDLLSQLSGMSQTEPGDGDDLGQPAGNIVLMPHQQSTFSSEPMAPGSARGNYGLHTSSKHHSSVTDKSSAWDVLKKVVDAMGSDDTEDADVMNPSH